MTRQAVDAPLGMMDGAYFTSRKEILDFFNSLLDMNLTKIEQTATGAVACQLMDYMFPGSIPMKRINWEAKSDFQYIENYKLLQAAFSKKKVQKMVDVDRLIRGKYQDNLEQCQWLKAFFEHASADTREDYDALARRQIGKGGKNLTSIFLPRGSKGASSANTGTSSRTGRTPSATGAGSVRSRSVKSRTASVTSASRRSGSNVTSASPRRSNTAGGAPLREINTRPSAKASMEAAAAKKVQKLTSQNEELTKQNGELKKKLAESELISENIEKERDFYFEKLRGIEVMLQVLEEAEEGSEASDVDALIQRVYKVLYAKIEDNIVVNDDGELLEDVANAESGDAGEGNDDLLNISMLSTTDPVEDLTDDATLDEEMEGAEATENEAPVLPSPIVSEI